MKRKWIFLAIILILVPWLGETLFNTKGEPREAIVAVTMLQSGDWVLPVSYGEDIPYKPPLLAWLIAIFSWLLNGGAVNEFTSRLPSALAATGMLMAGYAWTKRVKGERFAAITTLITVTSFEVFRSAVACRVDMVLTACIVGSMYMMWDWRELRGWWRLPVIALLLSGAVLTKGPVGALLPCLAMAIYCLISGDNFLKTAIWLTGVCAVSFIMPAIWYHAAWLRGGDGFLALALEENIGRLTGTMSYDSHLNPWWYNLVTIVAGMTPWTLLVILSGRTLWKVRRDAVRKMSPASKFALTMSLTILVFYCIPASKRSVYLLPMYPFMAYGVTMLITGHKDNPAIRIQAWIISVLAFTVPIVAMAAQSVTIGHVSTGTLEWWQYATAVLPVAGGMAWMVRRRHPAEMMIANTLLLYFAYVSAIQPMVLNPKSDRPAAKIIEEAAPSPTPVYSLIDDDYMRYYTINFYLGDRVRRLETLDSLPQGKCAVILPIDKTARLDSMISGAKDTVIVTNRSCDTRHPAALVRF